jgi:hypothetical protein
VDNAIVPWKLWHKLEMLTILKNIFLNELFFERVANEESFEIFAKKSYFGNEISILINYLTDMC